MIQNGGVDGPEHKSMENPLRQGCRSASAYQKLDKLGEGTYGSVYAARDKETGQLAALKRIKLSGESYEREGMPLTSIREVSLLRRLRHPHIVSLIEVVVGSKMDSVFLVLEHVDHDLSRLIDSSPAPFTPPVVKRLALQLFSAMAHLHGNHVLHRDLKLSNLLYSDRGELKLCDFGLARTAECLDPWRDEAAYTPKVVTLWYRAPELLLGARRYGAAVDVWSLGCVLGELLLRRPLMPAPTELKQLEAMCDLLGAPNERIWPGFSSLPLARTVRLPVQPYNELPTRLARVPPTPETLDLLNGLLAYDPRKRLSTREALKHPYFTSWPQPQPMHAMPRFGAPAAPAERSARKRPGEEATNGGAGSAGGARDGKRRAGGERSSRPSGPAPVCAQLMQEESASAASSSGAGTSGRGGVDEGAGGPRPAESVARVRSPSSVVVSGVRQL